ncbi:MAG: alpha/beta hydrolase [Enhygromyxa sp.]
MRCTAPLLVSLSLAALACKPEPPPTVEPSPAPAPSADEAPAPVDPRSYWIGSLALPNNKSLDWAISIEPPPEAPEGEPIAHLWIPEQLLMRSPLGAPKRNEDGSIEVRLAMVDATWTITPGDPPTCSFTQQGMSLDCDLEAIEAEEFAELMTPERPQNPKPPFPYAIEQVKIENHAAPGVTLAGTLTIPAGDGPHPGVVLISGSGLQDRDETIAEHKPFWVIADHLSRNGVAVLRYDDRGYAESTGDGTVATLEDFASDAHAAITWLAKHPAIDGDRVGLIGHSEGGVIAPLIASTHPNDVDFLVLLAGTGVPGSEIVVHQLGLIMAASGASPEAVERQQAAARAQHRALLEAADPAEARAAVERTLRASIAELPEAERAALGDVEATIAAQTEALASPWMRHFLAYDPIPALKRVKVPILILAGDKDLQVDPEQNLPPMKAALSKNRRVDVVRFAGVNHLFQPATTGAPAEYGVIEQTIAVEVLQRMTQWLQATAGIN